VRQKLIIKLSTLFLQKHWFWALSVFELASLNRARSAHIRKATSTSSCCLFRGAGLRNMAGSYLICTHRQKFASW